MEFRVIPGFETYGVARNGTVKNLKTGDLVSVFNRGRYLAFAVPYRTTKRKQKILYLHRALALAWLPRLSEGALCVNHINGDKYDNSLENLEWVTYGDNHRHAYRTGLRALPIGEKASGSILTSEQVVIIRKLLSEGVPQGKIAGMFSVSRGAILAIHAGKSWRHIGSADPAGRAPVPTTRASLGPTKSPSTCKKGVQEKAKSFQ